ncbi:MAG: hypothetical protein ACYC3G_00935 [Minisyncoccota bacterium]
MKALIVSGFDRDIFPYVDSVRFFDYLINEVGLTKDDIVFYGPAEVKAGIIFYNIFFALCKLTINEPLIIYYAGHGNEEGWDLKGDIVIFYDLLAKFLDCRLAPLIFINDCCFGMAAVDFLEKLKFRKLILALAPKDLVGETDGKSLLLSEIFAYWRGRRIAEPHYRIKKASLPKEFQDIPLVDSRLRWGDDIDYLLYPETSIRWRIYYASQIFAEVAEFLVEIVRKIGVILKPS